jgi:hypothetical protein
MTDSQPQPAGEVALVYAYRPSLLGAPWEFELRGNTLEFRVGRKQDRVDLRRITRVRLSFRPIAMQSQRFLAEIWADGAPKLEICSSSWKSMVEQERLDRAYATFVTELHRRLAQSGVPARFEQGSNPLLYWPGLVIFAAIAFALAALAVIGLRAHTWGGAAIVGAFLLLFLWQAGNFFRRNRPAFYRPDALPAAVVPRAAA